MEVIHCKDYSEIDDIPNKNGCYIDEDGDKWYYKNNLLHRDDDLPAIECSNGDKWYYRKGLSHRIWGHAIEWSDGEKWWYLFGVEYTEDDYNTLMSNLPLLYWKTWNKL